MTINKMQYLTIPKDLNFSKLERFVEMFEKKPSIDVWLKILDTEGLKPENVQHSYQLLSESQQTLAKKVLAGNVLRNKIAGRKISFSKEHSDIYKMSLLIDKMKRILQQKEYYNITDHSYHKGYLWLEYDCPMCNCRNDLECEPVIWFGEVKVACEDCNIQLLFKIDDEVIELA